MLQQTIKRESMGLRKPQLPIIQYTITLYNPSYTNLYVTVFIVKHNDKRQSRTDALVFQNKRYRRMRNTTKTPITQPQDTPKAAHIRSTMTYYVNNSCSKNVKVKWQHQRQSKMTTPTPKIKQKNMAALKEEKNQAKPKFIRK